MLPALKSTVSELSSKSGKYPKWFENVDIGVERSDSVFVSSLQLLMTQIVNIKTVMHTWTQR